MGKIERVPFDLYDIETLKELINECIVEATRQLNEKKIIGNGSTNDLLSYRYHSSNELYILNKVYYRIKGKEMRLEKSCKQLIGIQFNQVEIDVINHCLKKYADFCFAKFDRLKQNDFQIFTQKQIG